MKRMETKLFLTVDVGAYSNVEEMSWDYNLLKILTVDYSIIRRRRPLLKVYRLHVTDKHDFLLIISTSTNIKRLRLKSGLESGPS